MVFDPLRQAEQLEKVHQHGSPDLSKLMAEFTQRLGEQERRMQLVCRERDSLKRRLQSTTSTSSHYLGHSTDDTTYPDHLADTLAIAAQKPPTSASIGFSDTTATGPLPLASSAGKIAADAMARADGLLQSIASVASAKTASRNQYIS
ncbi:unnamed protein product [Protopolystoma xenopodis]|uniref:Uncharacterized protein n=1 Tax=Protopolystoma xenopodis TaxID=117903 RepID=A0A448X8I6_9PLAT|nr:unnamed protein product [Protopolystoma xenopodis]